MIGLVLVSLLCGVIGFWVGRLYELRRITSQKRETATERLMSPYEIALADFDRRIKFAHDHHMSVKHILAGRQNFVTEQLRANQINLEQMQCGTPDYSGLQQFASDNIDIPYQTSANQTRLESNPNIKNTNDPHKPWFVSLS